jgi:hypothetical protein
MIFSIHIPKTAGTSFRTALEISNLKIRSMYINRRRQICLIGEKCTFEDFAEIDYPISIPEIMTIVRSQNGKGNKIIVHGHFFYDSIAPFLEEGDSFIFWIRNPYDRLLSEWCHHVSRALKVDFDGRLQELNYSKMLELSQKTPAELNTLLTIQSIAEPYRVYLGSLPLDRCFFIGEFENYKVDLEKLSGLLGVKLQHRYDNVTPATSVLSPEFIDRVKDPLKNELEYYRKLVEFKRTRF